MPGRLSFIAIAPLAGFAACQAEAAGSREARPARARQGGRLRAPRPRAQLRRHHPARGSRATSASASPARWRAALVNVGDAVQGRPAARHPRRDRPAPAARAGRGRDAAPPRPPSPRPRRSSSASRPCAATAGRPPPAYDRQKAADRGGARPRRARRARPVARRERPLLRDPAADADGVVTATADRARPGGGRRPGGDPRRPARREGGRHRGARRRRSRRCAPARRRDLALVQPGPALRGASARAVALGRSGDPHLPGALLAPRRRTQRCSSA